MLKKYLFLISLILLLFSCDNFKFESPITPDLNFNFGSKQLFLDNGVLKVGVNLNWGGAIDFISFQGGPNLVDRGDPDPGRAIQVSLYDGNNYYSPDNWTGQWGWNPVQAGDRKRDVSGSINSSQSGNLIYVKSRPLQWNGSGSSDVVVEEWISLEHQKAIRITYKINHDGNDYHEAKGQEFPCVYLKPPYDIPTLVTYQGNSPWTDDGNITRCLQDMYSKGISSSENWVAIVGSDDKGITLHTQAKDPVVFGLVSSRTPHTVPFHYISAITFFNPSGVYETTVYLIFGSWQEARRIIYEINGLGRITQK